MSGEMVTFSPGRVVLVTGVGWNPPLDRPSPQAPAPRWWDRGIGPFFSRRDTPQELSLRSYDLFLYVEDSE